MQESHNPIHILYASRLVFEKWVDILISSIEKTLSQGVNIVWHICSNGPYQSEIIALTEKFPENVIYHGLIGRWAMYTLYEQADFLFMPSRFLETFGLTALESLASGTPVIWFQKGGLTSFIPDDYALDVRDPVESFMSIIRNFPNQKTKNIDISAFHISAWRENFIRLFPIKSMIFLLHDYFEKIGGAEIYVDAVAWEAESLWYTISRFSYSGSTTVWKRRWMFIFSLFAFWRGVIVFSMLMRNKPEYIWMHSVMRYIGIWWVIAVRIYIHFFSAKVYLSHHDIGLIVAFPQDITDEKDIPHGSSVHDFIADKKGIKRIIASIKWIYICILKKSFPKEMEHIIFSDFLTQHIKNHFFGQAVHVFPHSYDEKLFHT